MFLNSKLWSSVTISQGSKTFSFHCCAMPIIITSMSMFTMYIVKVEQIILFGKIVNQYFRRKESFSVASVLKFWWRFCENQGRENSVLVSCSFKAYSKVHRLAFTWLHLIMDIRVPGKWKICHKSLDKQAEKLLLSPDLVECMASLLDHISKT